MPKLMDEERFYRWAASVRGIRWTALNAWAARRPPLEVGDVVRIKTYFFGDVIGIVMGFDPAGYSVMLMDGEYKHAHRSQMTKVA